MDKIRSELVSVLVVLVLTQLVLVLLNIALVVVQMPALVSKQRKSVLEVVFVMREL